MKRKHFVLLAIMVLGLVKNGWSEEENKAKVKYDLGKVIVSATKTETRQAEVGSSSTVITAADLKKGGKSMIQDVLRNVPGLTVAQTGSFGGTTSVYLRGSKPGHTLVMIDGIEVNDPRGTDRSFDFAHLTSDNIESIEIIRGPQSVLYGSDAIGGVINIITKKGTQEKAGFEASLEGGSHNTAKESFGASGTIRKADYSFWLSKLDSSGISKARGGAERDGYSNATFSSRFGYQLLDSAKLNFILRSTYANFDIDAGSYDDDPNYSAWSRDIAGKIELEQVLNGFWDHRIAFNYYNLEKKLRNEKDAAHTADTQDWFDGDNKKIEWQNNFNLSDWNTVTGGLEYEKDRGSSYSRSGAATTKFDRRDLNNFGYYLQNQLKLWKCLFITPGIRVDDYEIFGKETTYKISSSYIFPEMLTRLKANLGSGFKSPSLFQLYSSFGNPALGPDKSLSYDLGLEQGAFDNKLFLGVTYFHNKFENMVDFDLVTSKYKNIGRAKTNGWETEFSFRPIEKLKLGMNYTYTASEDEETGKELARRPKNQASLNVNWEFIPKADLNLSLGYKGHNWNNAANTQKVKPYARIDLGFRYEFHKDFSFFTRIDNLLDRQYEDVRGFNGLDRSFFAGVKATF